MQKKKRKKNQHETKIARSERQKPLKNLRKINKNQKITYTHFDLILAPKSTQNSTPKRPKNEHKSITKRERKKERKKRPTWLQNDPKMTPTWHLKTNKKRTKKKNTKKERKRDQDDAKTWPSCERKAAYSNAFRYIKNVLVCICLYYFLKSYVL